MGVWIITGRDASPLGNFPPDIIDLLDITAQAGFIGNAIYNLVLLLESFQLLLPFVFRLFIMFHSISPTYHRSSHSILDGMFGAKTSSILGNMWGVVLFSNSCLLANNTIIIYTMVPVLLHFWGFVRAQDIIIGLHLPHNFHWFVTVRERSCPSRMNLLDMHCCYFPFIFNLDCGQKVTPIFIG